MSSPHSASPPFGSDAIDDDDESDGAPVGSVLWLVVALIAGGFLLIPRSAEPEATPAAILGPPTLADVWPNAAPTTYPARLPDGTVFTPTLHIDATTAVGTAPTADAAFVRVMLRTPTASVELRRLSKDDYPEVDGFTTDGDALLWAETTQESDGVRTRLWRANWRKPTTPTMLAADMGSPAFFQSQHDIVVADGAVHWVSIRRTNGTITEVRSMPLRGGRMSVHEERGSFALSAWPWLVTPYGGRSEPPILVNLRTGQRLTVEHTLGELTRCGPIWCRIGVTGSSSLIRVDLAHPDGSGRRRMAGGDATPVAVDVALLDRFEPLIGAGPVSRLAGRRLDLYDIATSKLVTVATGVTTAAARNGILWWATAGSTATWHVLDLRTLTP